MFRFNFDFEETVQQKPADCSQQEEARITPCEDENGAVGAALAKERQTMSATETVRYMQMKIALFYGEAVAFIARHIRTQYGKTYWQAQDEAATIFDILRRNQIRQALKEGRDDAAERLIQECREKFGMPDYLASSRANWPESFNIH